MAPISAVASAARARQSCAAWTRWPRRRDEQADRDDDREQHHAPRSRSAPTGCRSRSRCCSCRDRRGCRRCDGGRRRRGGRVRRRCVVHGSRRGPAWWSAAWWARWWSSSARRNARRPMRRYASTHAGQQQHRGQPAAASTPPSHQCPSFGPGHCIPYSVQRVVPEDASLAVVAHAGQSQEALDGVRVLRIGMRVVGREHDALVAEHLDHRREHRLVGVGRHVALASEVLARRHREVVRGAEVAREPLLVVVVHALEPERHPPASGFEERDAARRGSARARRRR